MILIITNKADTHINLVSKHFNENNVRWVRINVEDFATNVLLFISLVEENSIIRIVDSNQSIYIKDVKAIWYRKPKPVLLNHFNIDENGLKYIQAEISEILLGIYSLLKDRIWLNNPLANQNSFLKMYQLQVAHKIGFKIPNTIISNEENEILEFAKSHNWDIAIKSLGKVTVNEEINDKSLEYGMWNRRITRSELLAVRNKMKYLPTMYQEYIQKKYELRITCVDKEIFCCKINSQIGEIKDDMRLNIRSLLHEEINCDDIKSKLIDYLNYFGLNFGCFDFAVTENNEYVFFECNPNGQWLWIEEFTNMKISTAIANLLMNY